MEILQKLIIVRTHVYDLILFHINLPSKAPRYAEVINSTVM